MRILMVANTLPPLDISGVGEQVLQLAAGLRAEGHEVEVLGRGPGGARGPKLLFPLTILPAYRRALERFRPHVVQVHESDGALAAWWSAVVGPLLKPRPLLVALQQVSYLEEIRAVRVLRHRGAILGRPGPVERRFLLFKAPLQVILGSLTAHLADLVLAPSEATARELERDYRVRGVRVVPNVTGGLPREGGGTPEDGGGDDPAGCLLFVGRLRIRKGVEVLLHALGRARGRRPDLRLLVAGDGEHRGSLESLAERLDLGDGVRFLGRCDAGRVRQLMDRSLALTVPSIYEGMPLVILEAMERSLPVIASSVSGIPEVIVDGETGWLFQAEDVDRLEEILVEVATDPAEAARRGRAGTERLEERYRPASAARTWTAEIERVLGRRGDAGEMERAAEEAGVG